MRFTSWAVLYITCFSQVGLLFCSRLFATMSRASGKPMCPCGRTTLSQLTHKALITWAEFEGERWTWHSSNQAYFKYCEACHMFVWPRDGRYRGPHCKPGVRELLVREITADGRCRLLSGDFYLTRPPLEWVRPEQHCASGATEWRRAWETPSGRARSRASDARALPITTSG